jgi:hypothetical protein
MPPTPQADPNVAHRRISFHKVRPRAIAEIDAFELDRDAVAASVQALMGTVRFYLSEGDPAEEQSLCAVVDRVTPAHRLRFYRVRRRNLPETESDGVFEALELEERRGVAESIHMVFFDGNVVGSEYNHYGPRASTLGQFLNERCGLDVRLRPLVRADVLDQILRMSQIRKLRIKVDASEAVALRQSEGDLGSAFEAAEIFSAGRYVDLTLAARPSDERFTEKVKRLLSGLRQHGAIEHVGVAEVYGMSESGDLVALNLLHDQVTVKADIRRESPRSRALDRDSAYAAIESALCPCGWGCRT